MRQDTPPPTIHQTIVQPHRPFKNFIDIWAEMEDWYAKEIASPNPWKIPTEFLNVDQKREITRIALREGFLEASLLALIAPVMYGVFYKGVILLPEGNVIARIIALLFLMWPYLLIPLLPLIFLKKIRGSITYFIARTFAYARAASLIICSIVYSLAFIYIPWLYTIVFPTPIQPTSRFFYEEFILKPFSYLENSYYLLIMIGVASAIFPVFVFSLFIARAQAKADEIRQIIYGVTQEG